MIEGVDYAWSRPSPTALWSAGKRFACRYVGVGSSGKLLTSAEAHALCDAGLSIVTLVELAERSPMGGVLSGREHAGRAILHMGAEGFPLDRPYYFAVDFDATTAELSTVANYFEGVAHVLPYRQIGAYGGIRTLRYLFGRSLISWGFQTYAWSGGQWDTRAQLRQYHNGVNMAGGTVDLCRATVPDYGQWTVGTTDVPEGEVDMTPEESRWLFNASSVAGRLAAGEDDAAGRDPKTGERITIDLHPFWQRIRDVAAEVAQPAALTDEDREGIITSVIDGLAGRLGMIPTADEIGRRTAEIIRDRLES